MSANAHHVKSLKTLVLLAGVSAGVLFVPSLAKAMEPKTFFYPSSQWTIGPTGGDSDATSPRCIMVNEFNNGVVIGLDGTRKMVRYMNLDFKKNSFVPGKSYEITLSIPGQIMHKVNAVAKSNSHVQLDLLGLGDFYQTMRNSAVLDVTAKGDYVRFYMIGLTQNAKKFDTCLAQRPPATQQAAASAPSKSTPTLEVSMSDKNVPLRPDMSSAIEYGGARIPIVSAPSRVPASEEATTKPQPILRTHISDKAGLMTPMPGEEASVMPAPSQGIKGLDKEQQQKLLAARRKEGQRMSEMIADQIEVDPKLVALEGDDLNPEALAAPPFMNKSDGTLVVKEETTGDITTKTILAEDAPASARAKITSTTPQTRHPELETPPELIEAPEQFIPEPGLYTKEDLEKIFSAKKKTAAENSDEVLLKETKTANIDSKALLEAAEMPIENIEGGLTPPPPLEPVKEKDIKSLSAESPGIKVTREKISSAADFTDIDTMERESALGKNKKSLPSSLSYSAEQAELIEQKMQALKIENAMLAKELEAAQDQADANSLDISGDNWDLERATLRFQEAERQIKRLGQQLKRERSKWDAEKKELEAMLFRSGKTHSNDKQM